LSDSGRTAVRVDRRVVLIGVMCYEALMHIVYVEPGAVGSSRWPGYVRPQSTGADLKRAAAAWRIAEARHQYSLM
jgi:hypothetical protein